FSRFRLTIDGGPNGLLKNVSCPTNQDPPVDGNFTFQITGYTGRQVTIESPMSFEGCYGITKIKRTKCAARRLNVRAYFRSRALIREVRLYINGRRVATSKRVPFKFSESVRRYQPGRKRLMLRAIYKDGKVVKRSTVFKVC
ncbi:MAG: hypothetical protein HZB14_10240, partial [Actinobacteria bacterium]|nr:hypothetical protein [Actinomycetota bacterium]